MNNSNPLKNLKNDIPASIVVFFVAIPLCLGIALASGAPLFSGLIAGIIGGTIVGAISGSHVGVSGPAAGLAAIVLTLFWTFPAIAAYVVLGLVLSETEVRTRKFFSGLAVVARENIDKCAESLRGVIQKA